MMEPTNRLISLHRALPVLILLPIALNAQVRMVVERPKTPVLTAMPMGAPPTNVRTGATPTSISLKWTCPSDATGYEVYATSAAGSPIKLTATPVPPQCVQDFSGGLVRDPRLPAPTQTSYQTGYQHTGLRNGSEFTYVVRALYANGAVGEAAPVVGRTAAWPAPANVSSAPTAQAANLSWSGVPGALGYLVLRQLQGEASPRQVTPTPITVTSYQDAGLPPNTSFTYVVRALFQDGGQSESGPITGKTQLLPVPTAFQVSAAGSIVTLRWGTVNGATGYQVFRQLHGEGAFSLVTPTPITTTGYEDRGVPLALTHRYYVLAVNGQPTAQSAVVPGRPSSFGAQVYRGKPTVDFRWGGTAEATSLQLMRANSATGPFLPTKFHTNAAKDWARDPEAKVGATQYYKLLVTYPTGGVESDMATAAIPLPPQGITNLTGTSPGPGTAVLRWTCDPEATSYSVLRGKNNEAMDWIRPAGSSVPLQFTKCEYSDSGLWNGATYRYTVVGRYSDHNTSTEGFVTVAISP
jgi:large repetitive protein